MLSAAIPVSRSGNATSLIQKYATAATIGLFAVVGVTGILVFFHVGNGVLMGAHEWLGLAFVAASVLHVVRNGKGFAKLLGQARTRIVLGLVGVATAAFIASAAGGAGNPMKQFVGIAANAPISAVAPVLGLKGPDLLVRLEKAGVQVTATDRSFADIAKEQNLEMAQVFEAALSR